MTPCQTRRNSGIIPSGPIALILGSKGFDPIRFFYSWGLVTSATFLMLIGGFYAFAWLDKATLDIPFGTGIVMFFLAEDRLYSINHNT